MKSFFVTGGTLRHDAPCYVERQADRDLLEGLQRGDFCYVLTARQMGKSSLMVRTASKLRQQGVQVAVLDLTAVGQNLTVEQWYDGLLLRLGRHLHLGAELESYWQQQARLSPVQRFFSAIREVAMSRRPGQLVIFVDEIDTIRSLPFPADEFFAAMRECYNRRTEEPEFSRLTFCLLGVATPSDLIRNTLLTPFNIGRRIELHDFTEAEAAPLAAGLDSPDRTADDARLLLERILYWTRGHPYLTQRLCHAAAVGEGKTADPPSGATARRSIDPLCRELFLSHRAREQDDNLLFVRDRLLRNEAEKASLLTLYEQVRHGRPAVRDEETDPLLSILRLSGIVRAEQGCLEVRNRIYQNAFNLAWVRANMPGAELRRQRVAFWRGVARTTIIAVALLAAVAGLVSARYHARRAERVNVDNLLAKAAEGRSLGLAGQRFNGLQAVRQAARIERSLSVRNEAIACLALPDLRLGRTWTNHPLGSIPLAFDSRLEHYARSDARGTLSVRRIQDDVEISSLPGFGLDAQQAWLSSNNEYLAAAYPGERERILCLWQIQTRQVVARLTNALSEQAFDFSPDGKLAVVGGPDATVRLVELPSGRTSHWLDLPSAPVVLRFQPDGKQLAICRGASLAIEVYELSSRIIRHTYYCASPPLALAWSDDGAMLAAGCPDTLIYLFRREAPVSLQLQGHKGVPTLLAFSHNGRCLVSKGTDNALRLWNPNRAERPLVTWEGWEEVMNVPQFQFSPDDRWLAGNVRAGQLQLWEVESGMALHNLTEADAPGPFQVDISRNERLAATATGSGVVLWDLVASVKLVSLSLRMANAAVFNPATGDLVACSGFYGVIPFPVKYAEQNGAGQLTVGPESNSGLPNKALQLVFAQNGAVLAVLWDNHVAVHDARDYSLRSDLPADAGLKTLALAPDGKRVAAANWLAGEVSVWEVASGKKVASLPARGGAHLAFSPSGKWLTVGAKTNVSLWNTGTWQEEHRWPRSLAVSRPAPVAFAPDSTMLAFARSDLIVELTSATNGSPIAQLVAPGREPLLWLCFAPAGTRLAATTEGKSIQVWDLANLRCELATLGLDWELPAYAPITATQARTVRTSIEPGDPRLMVAKVVEREKELTQAINKRPEDPLLWRNRAYWYMNNGQHEKAVEDWKHYLSLAPADPWGLRDLAWIYLFGPPSLRNFPAAKELAAKAVTIEPGNADNHYRLGVACLWTDDLEKAMSHLQQAAKLSEGKPGLLPPFILVHQAIGHVKMGQFDAGQSCFIKALRDFEARSVDPSIQSQFRECANEARRWLEKTNPLK